MNPEENPLKQIRTFQGDIADAIKGQNESVVSIQRAEHARTVAQDQPEDNSSKDLKKSLLFLMGAVLLLMLGAAGGWYAYLEFREKTAPPVITEPDNRFIPAAQTTDINAFGLSRDELISLVVAGADKETLLGEVSHINIRTGEGELAPLMETADFLEALEARTPGSLRRAFHPHFMLGTLGGEEPSVFVIIRLESFENAFPGMLEWERYMLEDIGPLFATRLTARNLPLETPFSDLTSRNKDMRVLQNETGEDILMYSFFGNGMLIITDDEDTIHTLTTRLINEQLAR